MQNNASYDENSSGRNQLGADQSAEGYSRRRILAASAAVLAGASIGRVQAGPSSTDIGDKTPHLNFSLEGKAALITGAARGIGRAIAVALAAAGADVIGQDICAPAAPNLVYEPATADDLVETGKLVKAQKRRWIGMQGDVRKMADLNEAVERAVKEFGKLDIVIANAAIQIYGALSEMPDENWSNVIDINLNGAANTLRAVLPHMISRKYGRIVLIASGQGRHGFKNGSAYSASKWGMIGLMKSAALEVGKDGITVNCVEPGLVDTALTRNPGRWKEALKEAGKQPKAIRPRKRWSRHASLNRSWEFLGCNRMRLRRQSFSFAPMLQIE